MTRRRPRQRRSRGATIVLFGLLQVSLLTVAAIVVDLGSARAAARRNQTLADLAVLAAGDKVAVGDYVGGCRALVNNLVINAPALSAMSPDSLCAQPGNEIAGTICSVAGGLTQARPSVTVAGFTVSIHFPIPASEIWDSRYGAGLRDGQPCQRMTLTVSTREPVFFGGVVGSSGVTVTRHATLRAKTDPRDRIPALWLLDPTGCTALAASGGSRVIVGIDPTVPGIIKLDSDGSTCSSNQHTISSTGSNTLIMAVPTSGSSAGVISLYGLPPGATTCIDPICDAADVAGGRIVPQPTGAQERATRAPVDWRYNCRTSYPSYHGLAITGCADATPAYLSNLKALIGTSGNPDPANYQRWTTSHSCNPSGTVSVSGNWWVDCNSGLSIGNGTTVTFQGGNIVFDRGLSMTGGQLNINTANPNPNLPINCVAPQVNTPCISNSSTGAALVYVRSGNWDITGGAININHATVYQESGYVKIASATPTWTAPTEGPFAQLSLWSEAISNKFQINGGAGIQLDGVFFTPEANPLSLSGGGTWGQLNAQFVSYHIAISGGGAISMAPNASMIALPPTSNALIR